MSNYLLYLNLQECLACCLCLQLLPQAIRQFLAAFRLSLQPWVHYVMCHSFLTFWGWRRSFCCTHKLVAQHVPASKQTTYTHRHTQHKPTQWNPADKSASNKSSIAAPVAPAQHALLLLLHLPLLPPAAVVVNPQLFCCCSTLPAESPLGVPQLPLCLPALLQYSPARCVAAARRGQQRMRGSRGLHALLLSSVHVPVWHQGVVLESDGGLDEVELKSV